MFKEVETFNWHSVVDILILRVKKILTKGEGINNFVHYEDGKMSGNHIGNKSFHDFSIKLIFFWPFLIFELLSILWLESILKSIPYNRTLNTSGLKLNKSSPRVESRPCFKRGSSAHNLISKSIQLRSVHQHSNNDHERRKARRIK